MSKNRELTHEEKTNQIILAYQEVFRSEAGQIVLEDLRRHFSVSSLTMPKYHIVGNKTELAPIDPYRTHLDIGKLHVLGHIERNMNRELLSESKT